MQKNQNQKQKKPPTLLNSCSIKKLLVFLSTFYYSSTDCADLCGQIGAEGLENALIILDYKS